MMSENVCSSKSWCLWLGRAFGKQRSPSIWLFWGRELRPKDPKVPVQVAKVNDHFFLSLCSGELRLDAGTSALPLSLSEPLLPQV